MDRRERLALAGLVSLAAVCFCFRLGGVPLLGKDEPRYAEVAREMVVVGDWITPRLAGHTWFEKPALPYWLMAAGFSVFGINEFAARLGSALLAAVAAGAVYAVSRRVGGPDRAAYSAMVLISSGLWLAFARGASFDMPLAATMALAIAAFAFYELQEGARDRLVWSLLFGAATGAAMLAKGLAGPLLLGLIVVFSMLTCGSWRRVRIVEAAAAAAAALAIAGTWYVPVMAINGWPFVQEFFIDHHFRRYLTNRFSHPQPFYFFILVILGGLLPWTFVFLAGLKSLVPLVRRGPQTGEDRLLWIAGWSVVVPLVFFSLSTSKLPGYILPAFPGLALLTGWSAHRIEAEGSRRWAIVASALSLVAVGVGLALYGGRYLDASTRDVALLAFLPASAAMSIIAALRWRRIRTALWTVAAGGAGIAALISIFLFGEIGVRESLPALMAKANASLGAGERVLCFGVVEYSPVFYVQGRVVVDGAGDVLIAASRDEVANALRSAPDESVLVITDGQRAYELSIDPELDMEILERERNRVLLRVTYRDSAPT
ncbi:MAG: glycosyltransferase family 39 protein [Acidobacteria bacterium]|nr:glycosyltransferase family 39 protein [Acidobacteriota bacterium]